MTDMALNDFHKQVMKPMLLKGIREGSFDDALNDPECMAIILADFELMEAFRERVKRRNKEQVES